MGKGLHQLRHHSPLSHFPLNYFEKRHLMCLIVVDSSLVSMKLYDITRVKLLMGTKMQESYQPNGYETKMKKKKKKELLNQ